MKDLKLKTILKEILEDIQTDAPATVKFTMPRPEERRLANSTSDSSKSIYTNKDINFSNLKKKKLEKNGPSFSEYKSHFVRYEGKKSTTYRDTRGFLTVGIGHKFEKGEPVKKQYTEKEIDDFFRKDLQEAITSAKKIFPNFESLPKEVKIKLVSLTFNLGEGGISKFRQFRGAVANQDWNKASEELKNSRWYKQVGNRAKDYVNFFKSIA